MHLYSSNGHSDSASSHHKLYEDLINYEFTTLMHSD